MKNKNVSVSNAVKVFNIIKKSIVAAQANFSTPARRDKNLIGILSSFAVVPTIALATLPVGTPVAVVNPSPVTPQVSIVLASSQSFSKLLTLAEPEPTVDPHAEMLKAQGAAIDAYFAAHNMPLEGTGLKFATEADKNGLDWRLLPAISVQESTGGRHACKSVPNAFFGWGSCTIGFKTKDEAIETLARHLGGNDPATAKHYDNKTTEQILKKYNPPSVRPKYAKEVMSTMDDFGSIDLGTTQNTSSNTIAKINS